MIEELEKQLQKTEQKSVTAEMVSSRQLQEVQGMVFMAKKFPRDTFESWGKIKEACSRKALAEVAQYEYPRGGEKVSGPSIRLAEVLAQNWGNLSAGVVELEQRYGESTAMAYCWDLETNVRIEKIFTVKHERKTRSRGIVKLEDPRDIYEMVANQGARRLRACILSVIPKDIVDAAEEQCEKTLTGGHKEPLVDRVRVMFEKFSTEFSVNKDMIEKHLGCNAEAFTEKDVLKLARIFNSLKDGMSKRDDYFEIKLNTPDPEPSKAEKAFKSKKQEVVASDGGSDQINF